MLQQQLRVTHDKAAAKEALKQMIPSMAGGFIINTNRGDMSLHDDDARAVMELVAQLAARRAGIELSRATAADTAFVLVQEGGISSELYVHSWDSFSEAEDDRVACSRDGAYRTSPIVEVPNRIANQEGFYEAVEALLQVSRELECVEVPEEDEQARTILETIVESVHKRMGGVRADTAAGGSTLAVWLKGAESADTSDEVETALKAFVTFVTTKQFDWLEPSIPDCQENILYFEAARAVDLSQFIHCDKSNVGLLASLDDVQVGEYDHARGGVEATMTEFSLEKLAQFPADFEVTHQAPGHASGAPAKPEAVPGDVVFVRGGKYNGTVRTLLKKLDIGFEVSDSVMGKMWVPDVEFHRKGLDLDAKSPTPEM